MSPLPWLWLWALTAHAAHAANYCSICPEHTMCIYKSSGGPASRCHGLFSRDLTPDEAQAALHTHNAVRNKVAAGEERRGRFGQPQPPAANMHRLHWDEELAAFARRWASQCVFDQDTCRTSADGTPVGQNIYMQVLPLGHAQHSTVSTAMAVHKWLDEVNEHDGHLSSAPYTYHVPTWHYTNLVWGRSTRLGCGFADYIAAGGLNARLIVCNYKEGGNVVGSPTYLTGRPATQCGGVPSHTPGTAAPADAVVADGAEYAATTTSWWQVFPWLPTPHDDEVNRLLCTVFNKFKNVVLTEVAQLFQIL
ncbi:venom allergen 5-like [Thrips palmi]|uniref:Venom allergen 5-like n=1 Tax=Thrips palmi TaxID=161013 RepID=A0A6P8Z6Y0_THRPL|nr:venom allergen 5-like [Thrips palmi]